jgi:tetratricopeptide (TPR) repeat protein
MRYRFFYSLPLSLVLLFTTNAFSQGGQDYLDSLKKRLDTMQAVDKKVRLMTDLIRFTMDRKTETDYAERAIELAQGCRDQRLIASTYEEIGDRLMSNSALADNVTNAMTDFQKAEGVAKENGLEDILVRCYCGMSLVYRLRGDDAKALTYCTQALAIASGGDNDSVKATAYASTGNMYEHMDQMLLALRNYLSELDVAEKSGDDMLMRNAYTDLYFFYEAIKEYDKAIDYQVKAYTLDRKRHDFNMANDLNRLGSLYLEKDEPRLAEKFYEQSIRTADTLHFALLRVNAYHLMFLLYLKTRQYQRGLQYLFSHQDMLNFLHDAGLDFYLDQLLATNYTQQGRYDSADYYFRRAEPQVMAKLVRENQFDFLMDRADYYKRTKDLPQAIACSNKAYAIGAALGQLSMEEKSTDTLEGLYEAAANFPAALVCNKRAAIERDSLRAQAQTTDLMKLEVENEGRRRERLAREQQEQTEHRHNLQYMGFTMGLVVLFVALVTLARLSVPIPLIRAFVFVAFIFLFEFIIMLADKRIQGWTAEEPWKVLLLKILLAAGMVPAHHWLEHKVVLYLSRHKKAHGQPAGGAGHIAVDSPGQGSIAGSGQGSKAGPGQESALADGRGIA